MIQSKKKKNKINFELKMEWLLIGNHFITCLMAKSIL